MTEPDSGDVTPAGPADDSRTVRRVCIDGVDWLVRLDGHGSAGSGVLGLGRIQAIRFDPPAGSPEPAREVLVQKGRFESLFDAELVTLFARARPARARNTEEESH
jgi:hypothetical protein